MNPPTMYTSFLVRVWQDAEAAAPAGRWRVEIEHIQNGQQHLFDTLEQALDFLYRQAQLPEPVTPSERKS